MAEGNGGESAPAPAPPPPDEASSSQEGREGTPAHPLAWQPLWHNPLLCLETPPAARPHALVAAVHASWRTTEGSAAPSPETAARQHIHVVSLSELDVRGFVTVADAVAMTHRVERLRAYLAQRHARIPWYDAITEHILPQPPLGTARSIWLGLNFGAPESSPVQDVVWDALCHVRASVPHSWWEQATQLLADAPPSWQHLGPTRAAPAASTRLGLHSAVRY